MYKEIFFKLRCKFQWPQNPAYDKFFNCSQYIPVIYRTGFIPSKPAALILTCRVRGFSLVWVSNLLMVSLIMPRKNSEKTGYFMFSVTTVLAEFTRIPQYNIGGV